MLTVLSIGAGIVAVYVLALWWLLRGERQAAYTALVALCGVALALRLVLTHDYPAGLNGDEPKNLSCSMQAVDRGQLFSESCNGPPYLLSAVFAVPLVPITGGPNRWAMRSYSMALSVLAVPAAFAVARAMGLRLAGALVAAGLVGALPWALYYGRITLGGELIFHQLLLLAALARLVWPQAIARRTAPPGVEPPPVDAGWREALLGGFALSMLLWDYFAGRAMMGMPLLAAVLATGRRRLWCLAVPVIAVALWVPHLASNPGYATVGFSFMGVHDDLRADPLVALWKRTQYALWTFVWPVAQDSIFTVRAAAVHPVAVLALAAVGALTGVRRFLFLAGGFAGGILPGIVSHMWGVSAHRIMMAYVFVALAAACAVNLPPWRPLRAALAVAVLVGATVWSTAFYFSPEFWGWESRITFDADRTALGEALADEPRRTPLLIVMHQVGDYAPPPPPGGRLEILSVDNWLPTEAEAATYAFSWEGHALRAQYERLFPGRVKSAGSSSFYAQIEAADWSWLRRHGWSYEVKCGDAAGAATVPFLYSLSMPMQGIRCLGPPLHIWRARWSGPATDMMLDFGGRATIQAGDLSLEAEGFEQRLPFTMPADSDVTVTLQLAGGGPPWPRAVLFEVAPHGRRVPDWERFTPLPPAAAAEPAAAPPPQP